MTELEQAAHMILLMRYQGEVIVEPKDATGTIHDLTPDVYDCLDNTERDLWDALLRAETHTNEWRPIESAPISGDLLLGWYGKFSDEWKTEVNQATKWDRSGRRPHLYATHWMPLPKPPMSYNAESQGRLTRDSG